MQVASVLSAPYASAFSPQAAPIADDVLAKLRQQDATIRSQANKLAQTAADGATVTVQFQFVKGPDGKLYASSSTVSTTQRVTTPEDSLFARTLNQPNNPTSFAQINRPKPQLAPDEEAFLFGGRDLSQSEKLAVDQLRAEDLAVRRHENSHFRAAGEVAVGTPDYVLIQGPDGRFYAVGGSQEVAANDNGDPEDAVRQAQALSNAATAPGDASSADFAAARSAFAQAAALYSRAGELQPLINLFS